MDIIKTMGDFKIPQFTLLTSPEQIAVYAQGFRVHTNESKTDRYEIFYNNINAWINVPGQIFVL